MGRGGGFNVKTISRPFKMIVFRALCVKIKIFCVKNSINTEFNVLRMYNKSPDFNTKLIKEKVVRMLLLLLFLPPFFPSED